MPVATSQSRMVVSVLPGWAAPVMIVATIGINVLMFWFTLTMLGLDCGPVRRPLPDFPETERSALKEALAGLGVLEREAVA